LVAPPGSGKTVMAVGLIARRACRTLMLVHRRPLLEQWVKSLARFLGLEPSQIGVIGTREGVAGIDVEMIQSLTRRDDRGELLGGYGHVVVDERHHVSAVSVEALLREIPCRYVTGLTATPRRRDGHHPIIAMQCGPVRHTLGPEPDVGSAVRRVVIERRTDFDPRPCRPTRTSRRSSGRSRPIQSARAGSPTTSWPSWPQAVSRSC
jgi:superfamily II DNA or RNA helicase